MGWRPARDPRLERSNLLPSWGLARHRADAVTGVRIGAIAIKWSDFDGDVLHVSRRIYEGNVGSTKTKGSNRRLPIPDLLLSRMRLLGKDVWVFHCKNGGPINPGKALKRYIRPVAEELNVHLGGWHDFRHSLTTELIRNHTSPKVVEDTRHSDVNMTLNV